MMKKIFSFLFVKSEVEYFERFKRDFDQIAQSLNYPNGLSISTTNQSKIYLEPHNQFKVYLELSFDNQKYCDLLISEYSGTETFDLFPGDTILISGKY